jgi:hypothetical protein
MIRPRVVNEFYRAISKIRFRRRRHLWIFADEAVRWAARVIEGWKSLKMLELVGLFRPEFHILGGPITRLA